MRVHDAPTEHMIAVLLQPSLPPADHDQSSRRGAGAFLLQALSQSRIVVGFGPDLFAAGEAGSILKGRRDRQVALPDIHADDAGLALGRGVSHLHFQGNQQVEALLGLVVPEFGCSDLGPTLKECHMLVIARVGHNHASTQRQDADVLAFLQAVVAVEVVGQRRGDVVGRLVEPLVAFLGASHLALLCILCGLRPQAFVGGPHLPGNVTGHLRGKPEPRANVVVALALQPLLAALLAMRKRVARDVVQRVPVGEARLSQRLELRRRGVQFQFGGQRLFHSTCVPYFTGNSKQGRGVNVCAPPLPQRRDAHCSPWLEGQGTPGRFVELLLNIHVRPHLRRDLLLSSKIPFRPRALHS